MKYCSSCKAGEIYDEPAKYLVTGKLTAWSDPRPYKAWLCQDHFTMLEMDGEKLKIIKTQN